MQYHLTKGVQIPFLFIASHERSRPYKKLRSFLIRFAYEEETHFKLAESDLKKMGASTGEIPLDVEIWWSYYTHIMKDRPFVRLGATCILENIGNGTGDVIKTLMNSAGYLDNKNTTFLKIHMHEELPHGDQILDALAKENFLEKDMLEIQKGLRNRFYTIQQNNELGIYGVFRTHTKLKSQ